MTDPCLSCPLPTCNDRHPRCAYAAQRERQRAHGRAYRARWRAAHPIEWAAEDIARSTRLKIERIARQLLQVAA